MAKDKKFQFYDSRHHSIYTVFAPNKKAAKSKLKSHIVGNIWDDNIDNKTLWYYITLVDNKDSLELI